MQTKLLIFFLDQFVPRAALYNNKWCYTDDNIASSIMNYLQRALFKQWVHHNFNSVQKLFTDLLWLCQQIL